MGHIPLARQQPLDRDILVNRIPVDSAPAEFEVLPLRRGGVKQSRNHASGTPSVRPSSISTHMQSSSKRSALGEILMPCPLKLLAVLLDQTLDTVEGPGVEAVIVGHHHCGREPEFSLVPTFANVDVGGLARVALVRVEVEFEAVEAQDDRHQERPSKRDQKPATGGAGDTVSFSWGTGRGR